MPSYHRGDWVSRSEDALMPATTKPKNKNSETAHQSLDWRRIYAASIVGIAAFLIGLMIWPSRPLLHRTDSVINLDAGALAELDRDELQDELNAIKDELLQPEHLAEISSAILAEGVDRSHVKEPEQLRRKIDQWGTLLVVKMAELQKQDEAEQAEFWVEVSLVGSGSQLETRFINRIAADVALSWQRRLIEVAEPTLLRDVRANVLELTRRHSEMADRTSSIGQQQIESIVEHLVQSGWTQEEEQSLAFRNSISSSAAASRESSSQFSFASDSRSLNQQPPSNMGMPQTENPQWRSIVDQIQRIDEERARLQQENYWTLNHPEVKRLSDELEFLRQQLTRVERFDRPTQQRTSDRQPLGNNSFASVETNRFYRGPQESNHAGVILPEATQPAVDFQLDMSGLESQILVPLNELHQELVDTLAAKDIVLEKLDAAVLDRPEVRQGRVTVTRPATVSMVASSNGRWRFMLLIGLSGSIAIFFGTTFGTQLDSKLSNPAEVESALRIPVLGVIGQLPASAKTTRWQRWHFASLVTRSAEAIVFALIALVILMVLFNTRLAHDLVENPLLTLSEILGSLMGR